MPEAVANLQEFAKTSDVSAPGALFAIGSALAEDHEDDKAIGILESLLVAYPTSPWIPAANYQLGQLYARTGKADQAIKALQNCIATSPDPALVRAARSQLGYVLLNQAKDYAGAAAQFALISDGTDASAENAAYNFLLAQAYLGKNDVFVKAEADFEKRFPAKHAPEIHRPRRGPASRQRRQNRRRQGRLYHKPSPRPAPAPTRKRCSRTWPIFNTRPTISTAPLPPAR